MKQLRKQDRKAFDAVCKTIRQAMHLDHLHHMYVYESKDTGNIATTKVFSRGWRLLIRIFPQFWTHPADEQLRFLIHEHVHVCLHPYHQAVDSIEDVWVSSHDRSQVNEKNHIAAEIAVDHLESVLYELLKDRF